MTDTKGWSKDEINALKKMVLSRIKIETIAVKLHRSIKSVNQKIWHLNNDRLPAPVQVSSMPKYNQPLKSEGDAVILSDVEAPFHHADFINQVLELADKWNIRTLHLAGDLLHFDNLSAWGAEWIPDDTEGNLNLLLEYVNSLPTKHRENGINVIEQMGAFGSGTGLADELTEARRVFRSFTNFDNIFVAIGNHDDRYLRALNSALHPKELLIQLDTANDERWKIAPYYYTLLETERGLFRVEHPRASARTTAQDLCAQYHCNIIMGHSHRWAVNRDVSGDFWAIQSGHCVDEERLAYVMQRSAKRDAHCLGATIVRGGVPWVLGAWSQWDLLKRL